MPTIHRKGELSSGGIKMPGTFDALIASGFC